MSFYQRENKGLSMFALIKEMANWKDDDKTAWLKDVNSQALQMTLRNLDVAYTKFFKKTGGFPCFKSKYDNFQSFCNPQSTTVDYKKGIVCIPKFKNGIKTIFHRNIDGRIKSSTVLKTSSGKYFISILVENNKEYPTPEIIQEDKTLGVDLGIKNYATFSNGVTIKNPRFLKKKIKSIKLCQRRLSRKRKGGNNRRKQQHKLALLHETVANIRKDFIHKLTYRLTKNQGYSSIAIEDLSVSEMMRKGKRNKLSRHIVDAGWGMFRSILTYKCISNGKNLLVIGRFEPSSKLCQCGYLNYNLTLSDRKWDCPNCRTNNDRDILAANNIKRFAFCKQNTNKISEFNNSDVRQELPKRRISCKRNFKTPLEFSVRGTLKKEAINVLL